MIENKQQRPILIASFSGVLGDGLNSPIRRLAFPGVRGSPLAAHESEFTRHSPPITCHRPNQSLAKHNRKPSKVIENNHQLPKSIASFCRHFAGHTAPRYPGSPYFYSIQMKSHQITQLAQKTAITNLYSIQMSPFSPSQLRNSFARRAQADAADHARHESQVTSHKSLRDDRACRSWLSGGESLWL